MSSMAQDGLGCKTRKDSRWVLDFLRNKRVPFEVVDFAATPEGRRRMAQISGDENSPLPRVQFDQQSVSIDVLKSLAENLGENASMVEVERCAEFFIENGQAAKGIASSPGLGRAVARGDVILTESPEYMQKVTRGEVYLSHWLWESVIADRWRGGATSRTHSDTTRVNILWV